MKSAPNGCLVWNAEPEPDETVSWSGKCVKNYAEGKGTLIWSRDGQEESRFEGTLRAGKAFTAGKVVWVDGRRYEGNFNNSVFDGKGSLQTAEGRYDGMFRNGRFNGRGVMEMPGGARREGAFKDDLLHGEGLFVNAGGDRYEGTFQEGKFNGKGRLTFARGDSFAGEFEANLPNGYGEFIGADGNKASGRWRDGCLVGSQPAVAVLRAAGDCH